MFLVVLMTLVRPFVAWLPVVLMTVLGSLYFANCVQAALAPGKPFDFKYQGTAGPVLIHASSYALDPISRTLALTDVVVQSTSSQEDIAVGRVQVRQDKAIIDVKAFDARAILIKGKDGLLSALNLLPKEKTGAESPPVRVTVDKLDLTYIDEQQAPAVRQLVRAKNIIVDSSPVGIGGTLSAEVVGSGFAVLHLELPKTGDIRFDLTTSGFNIVPFVPVARGFLTADQRELLRPYTAQSAVVVGHAFGLIPKEGKPVIAGEGSVSVKNVRAPEWLDQADVEGQLAYADGLLRAEIISQEPGRKLVFDGGIDTNDGLRVVGGFQANLRDRSRLWTVMSKVIPPDLKFSQADYKGIVDLKAGQYKVSGRLTANSLGWKDYATGAVSADLAMDSNRVMARIDRTTFRGYPLAAWADINLKSGVIKGAVNGLSDNATAILASFGAPDWSFRGTPTAIISGTLKSPEIVAGASGFVSYRQNPETKFDLGFADIRLSFKGETLRIDRGVIAGQYGTARIDGEVRNFGKQLQLSVEAGDLSLNTLDKRLSGLAFFKGNIKGTFDSPHLTGNLVAYDGGFETYKFPQGEAAISLEDGILAFDNVRLALGLGQATGSGTYTLKDQEFYFAGQAEDVFASDYTELPIFGRIKVDAFAVSGQLGDLSAEFVAESQNLLAYEVPIDTASIKGTWKNGKIGIQRVLASVGQGTVDAKGEFDPATAMGEISGTYKDVSLIVLPVDRGSYDVHGTISGKFEYASLSKSQSSGQVTGQVANLAVNRFEIGPGEYVAQIQGDKISFQGSAGSPQGFVSLENGTFNLKDNSYGARIAASGLSVSDLYRSLEDQLTELAPRDRQAFSTLQGQLTLELVASGTEQGLQLSAEYFEATGLELQGTDLGNLKIVGSALNNRVDISSFLWKIGEGSISGTGSWHKDGPVTGKLNLDHVQAGVLRSYFTELPDWEAVVNSELDVSGTSENPLVSGDLSIREVKDSARKNVPIEFSNGAVTFRDNGVRLTGRVSYEDLAGNLAADVPIDALSENPTVKAKGELTFEDVELTRLSRFMNGVDVETSKGKIGGNIRIEGDSQSFGLLGAISLGPDSSGKSVIKLKESDTRLDDLSVIISGQGEKINFSLQGFSGYGGLVTANAVANLGPAIESLKKGDKIAPISLQGNVEFDEFRVKQKIKLSGTTKNSVAEKPSEATLYGTVNIKGDILKPIVSGDIEANGLIINLPPEIPEAQKSESDAFQPFFDNLRIIAGKRSRVNLSLGNIDMSGVAMVAGPLSEVVVQAPLTIEGGTFNLPTSRVKLEEGGSVNIALGNALGGARIDVDMKGKTRVTVRQTDSRYQNYELTLDMRGNLLEPNGVALTGESDPPDLSQERIKAIVGQQDLIETLAATVLGKGSRGALTEGVYSIAVPTLTQGFTENIAKALKLDYFVLDYNPFDLATFRAGLSLGKGLTVEASRQLTATDFTQPKYEILLTYRMPSRNPLLSRTRFFVGTDYQVPWKVGLNYSFKF